MQTMQKRYLIAAGGLGVLGLAAAYRLIPRGGPVGNRAVPDPKKAVDVYRYMGRWYEQFRYEASFQKGMESVSADYSLNPDGTVKVVNRGRKHRPDGPLKTSEGTAKIVDTATNAKLKVSFFGPFYGDYWVLDHGDDYDWAIIGEPSGRYLWALTRASHPTAETIAMLKDQARSLGYDTTLIRMTRQL